ncbi:hypothetical protein D3C85_616680 [compost metagenome]
MRIARQRQVVRGVLAGTVKAEALDGLGDRIGHGQRIVEDAAHPLVHPVGQPLLQLVEGTDEGGRIAAVEADRIETAVAQMLDEALQPREGAQLGALLDAPAVGDHHRQRHPAILGAPPARHPVAAALLLGRAVGEEGHQGLAGQRLVGILQLGKAEIAALGDAAGGMRVDVAAQGHAGQAVGRLGIAVEVIDQAVQAFGVPPVARRLLRVQVAGQHVERLDGRHAVPLAHGPGAGLPGQGIQRQVAGIGRHHVQGAAGVAFGAGLEILGQQLAAVEMYPAGVGHVHDQPQTGASQSIESLEQAVDAGQIGLAPGLHQLVSETEHRRLGGRRMLQRTTPRQPLGEGRLGERMGLQFFGAGQKLTHGQDSKAGLEVV